MNTDLPDYKFKRPPLDHQRDIFVKTRDLPIRAHILEMGTGKSKIVIDTAAYNFTRGNINALVILASKTLCLKWKHDDIPKDLPVEIARTARIHLWRGGHTKWEEAALDTIMRPEPLRLHVLLINYEALNTEKGSERIKQFIRAHDVMFVVDESTAIGWPTTQRFKRIMRLRNGTKMRRILTGHPGLDTPLKIFGQYEFLDDELLGCSSFGTFKARYAVTHDIRVSGRTIPKIVGWQRLDELQNRMSLHSDFLRKEDCLDLPPKTYEEIPVELPPELRKHYDKMRDQAILLLEQGHAATAPLVITQLMKLRQILCGFIYPDGGHAAVWLVDKPPKLEAVLETLEDVDGKVQLWTAFKPVVARLVKQICDVYGPDAARPFAGGVDADERQRYLEAFQDRRSPLRFLVTQVATGSHGLTATAAPLALYHDNEWSLEKRLQSEDRIHRIGQDAAKVTYVDYPVLGTVEQKILRRFRSKLEIADQLVPGAARTFLGSTPE